MSNETIINRLLNIEAWAEGLREECHKTRVLIQKGGVSTPAGGQQKGKIDMKQLCSALVKKRRTMIKNRPLK